jgi:hypothetical protein
MKRRIPFENPSREELCRLAALLLGGDISDGEAKQFERLVVNNPMARRFYLEFICDACNIRLLTTPRHFGSRALLNGELGAEALLLENGETPLPFSEATEHFSEAVFVQDSLFGRGVGESLAACVPSDSDRKSDILGSEPPASGTEPVFSTLPVITKRPIAKDNFRVWAFAYMVATVVLCAMVLALRIIPHSGATDKSLASARPIPQAAMVFVGRITGMKDCHWADPDTETHAGSLVPVGQKYSLTSGLMEITFVSGATVILEGPCTYEVESAAGGFLAVGKLLARVESRARKVNSAANQKSENISPKSPSSLFAVRTPTSIVTDLGTEFGVEVDEDGHTASYVYQGSVKIQPLAAQNKTRFKDMILRKGESIRVVDAAGGGGNAILNRNVVKPETFLSLHDFAAEQAVALNSPFLRWKAFSERFSRRNDLLAYYDFQPDAENISRLPNRASTGRQFDGEILDGYWGAGRFRGKYGLRFNRPGGGVRINIPTPTKQLTIIASVYVDETENYSEALLASDGWPRSGAVHFLCTFGGRREDGPAERMPSLNERGGRWCHLAIVSDAPAGKNFLYLNGDPAGPQEIAAAPEMVIGSATIGSWDVNPDWTVRGSLDELMIFKSALTPEEIRELFSIWAGENQPEKENKS